jgi:hypothetical protein
MAAQRADVVLSTPRPLWWLPSRTACFVLLDDCTECGDVCSAKVARWRRLNLPAIESRFQPDQAV